MILYLVVKSKVKGKRTSKFIIVNALIVNTAPPVNTVAFGLVKSLFSMTSDTGTSKIEIAEVNAAILNKKKKRTETIIPETPIMSNSMGKTSKIRFSPDVNRPLASYIFAP